MGVWEGARVLNVAELAITLVNLSSGLVQQTSALFGQELSKQKLNVILYKNNPAEF